MAAVEAADEGLIEAEFDVDVGPLVANELAAFVEEPVGGLIEVGGAGERDVCEAERMPRSAKPRQGMKQRTS